MELGPAIDMLYETRAQRLALTKEVDELKAHESVLKEELLTLLHEIGLEKASGQKATVGVRRLTVPIITDWEEIHKYIKENDRFDLIQKRLSAPAWRELKEQNVLVPGTEAGTDVELSLTKSTR
jgi:hypothetical protein